MVEEADGDVRGGAGDATATRRGLLAPVVMFVSLSTRVRERDDDVVQDLASRMQGGVRGGSRGASPTSSHV
jgi:hypothetical protein